MKEVHPWLPVPPGTAPMQQFEICGASVEAEASEAEVDKDHMSRAKKSGCCGLLVGPPGTSSSHVTWIKP